MSKYDIILDVYENQSISKAAAKHNYTQSAVSQTIRNYEKEIGVTLFKRSKTGMSPLTGTDSIFEELKKRNIYVRYFNKPRIDNYLRISIGTDAQMQALYAALKEIVNA